MYTFRSEFSIKKNTMRDFSAKPSAMKALSFALVIVLFLYSNDSVAQWATNSYLNNPICTQSSTQQMSVIVPDGAGGAIITWLDLRVSMDIYAQRIDVNGNTNWTNNGISVCSAAYFRGQPVAIPDGLGGAIIAWPDYRNGNDFDIYVQRINGNGTALWETDGVLICGATGDQTVPVLVSDGNGGAIITWTDARSADPNNYDIFAQGINSNGTLKWALEVGVCTFPQSQLKPSIFSDGSGGAVIGWYDTRNESDGTSVSDIYAQRISASGSALWTANGVSICKQYRMQSSPVITSDGVGGFIFAWDDERNLDNTYPYNSDIFAQRVNINGVVQWAANGIGICTTTTKQTNVCITSDMAGGAVIAWQDWSGFSNYVYFQHVDGNGTILLAGGGLPIGSGGKSEPVVFSDGNGGTFLTWIDNRGSSQVTDIYAQHLDASCTEQWAFGGVPVSTAFSSQLRHHSVYDGNGGIIVAWEDYRNVNIDIYAQHLKSDGTCGSSVTTGTMVIKADPEISIFPNPFVDELSIDLSYISQDSPVVVTLLDASGKVVNISSGNGIMKMNLGMLKPASYLLSIRYEGHQVNRLIVKR
jgi:hypothetical protein